MNRCGINDIEVGEIILAMYPLRSYGTVSVDKINIPERKIFVTETWGPGRTRVIYFPKDYGYEISKIKKEWDNEENISDSRCRLVSTA